MRAKVLLLSLAALLLAPLPASAASTSQHLGAVDLRGWAEFDEVIEIRCTVCHTRERVDIAMKKKKRLEDLQKRMMEKGAVLTERDKSVLGTFWGSPLKRKEEMLPEPSH